MTNLKDKVVFGGLYSYSHSRFESSRMDLNSYSKNDQIYHLAVPYVDKDGNLGFQDTYQIRLYSGPVYETNYDNQVNIFKSWADPEKGNWATYYASNFYYTSSEIIKNESMLNDYKLICNLEDFKVLDASEDILDYEDSDVVRNVRLWNECGYPRGLSLVRKNAVPNKTFQFDNKVAKLIGKLPYSLLKDFGFCENKELRELNETADTTKLPEYTIKQLEKLNKLTDILSNFEKEYVKAVKECNDEISIVWNYEKTCSTKLKDVHSDIERYLEHDCYCPNEVYDTSGFTYELFTGDTPIKLFHVSDVNTDGCSIYYGIAKASNCYYPQILEIMIDSGKCENIVRCDVTRNNIEFCKSDKTSKYKLEHQPRIVFEDDLNHLIDSLEETRV